MPDHSLIEHNGGTLSYSVSGHGPPVLLIQGAGLHGDGWSPQVEALAHGYRCLSFDNRGIGKSRMGPSPITIESMADDAGFLMDTLGWPSAHIVGHSIGGLVALRLATSEPARARSLSLLCTFARGSDASALSAWMLWVGLRTRVGTRRQRRRAFLEMVMPPETLASESVDALAEHLAPIFGHDLADQPPIVMEQLRAARRYDATPRLHELSGVPALVVSAAHDRIAPPQYGKAIAAAIAGSVYVEIEDAAHGVTIQRADRVNRLLMQHFANADTRHHRPR